MLVTSQIGTDLFNIQQTNRCFVLEFNEWGDFHVVCILFILTTECGIFAMRMYWSTPPIPRDFLYFLILVNKTNDINTHSKDYCYTKG